jgi:hypothetical protein
MRNNMAGMQIKKSKNYLIRGIDKRRIVGSNSSTNDNEKTDFWDAQKSSVCCALGPLVDALR